MSLASKIGSLFGTGGAQLEPALIGLPSGTVAPFAGSVEPTGWLFCYGQAVSRTTYAALFAAIDVAYGAGDGTTTFNVPDCRGRVVAGKDDMGGTAANRLTTAAGGVNGALLGHAAGTETHTLTSAQMPTHNHGVTDPGHTHTSNANNTNVNYGVGGGSTGVASPVTAVINSAATGISIQNTGSGTAHPNVQPTLILNSIIKI